MYYMRNVFYKFPDKIGTNSRKKRRHRSDGNIVKAERRSDIGKETTQEKGENAFRIDQRQKGQTFADADLNGPVRYGHKSVGKGYVKRTNNGRARDQERFGIFQNRYLGFFIMKCLPKTFMRPNCNQKGVVCQTFLSFP